MRFFSDALDYDAATKTFSAEASDLAHLATAPDELFHYLYDDANDMGITIISLKTGAEVEYYLSSKTDDWIDYQWTLSPTAESVRKYPGCAGTTVTIYND